MPSDVSRRDGRVTGRALQSSVSDRRNGGGEFSHMVHVRVVEPSFPTVLSDLSYKHSGLCAPAIFLSILYLPDKQHSEICK